MDLDKNKTDLEIREIEFNWERVIKKANLRRGDLIKNAPNITTREVGRTQTTDERIEPEIIMPENYPVPATPMKAVEFEEDDGPDRNVIEIVKKIKNKEISGRDLTVDERRIVVNSLKGAGQTQDSIADLLGVSRRTIVNDYRILRHQAALRIANTETNEIAGEVYEVAKVCMRKALAAGHYKTVSTVMRDMVEVLQSLGIVYRAPKTSMQASLIGNLNQKQGYHKYMEAIGDDKDTVVQVLDHMFDAISNNRI